jgi:hypothetical protein
VHISKRRIWLSWDLHNEMHARDYIVLKEKLHRQSRSTAEHILSVLDNLEDGEAVQEDVDLAHDSHLVFYHLRDPQRLVSQMCIQS